MTRALIVFPLVNFFNLVCGRETSVERQRGKEKHNARRGEGMKTSDFFTAQYKFYAYLSRSALLRETFFPN